MFLPFLVLPLWFIYEPDLVRLLEQRSAQPTARRTDMSKCFSGKSEDKTITYSHLVSASPGSMRKVTNRRRRLITGFGAAFTPWINLQGVASSNSTRGCRLPSALRQVIVRTTARMVWPRSTTLVCSWRASRIHRRSHRPSQTFSQEHDQELPWRAIPPARYWD